MKFEPEELKAILSEPELGEAIMEVMLKDSEAIDELMEEFSGQLTENLETHPMFHKRLTQALVQNAHFRARMMEEIVAGWSRD